MSAEVARKLFTVDEYYRMGEAGILKEDDRVELIEGEIIEMSPIGIRHAACVRKCQVRLSRMLGDKALVSVQNPVRIDVYNEPEPDIAVVSYRADFYETRHPEPRDVLLIIEVMESSTAIDREQKLPLYARAGIPEVWLIDLNDLRIETYAEPSAGGFQRRTDVEAEHTVRSATLDLEVEAGELLPQG